MLLHHLVEGVNQCAEGPSVFFDHSTTKRTMMIHGCFPRQVTSSSYLNLSKCAALSTSSSGIALKKYALPSLPFDPSELEPVITSEITRIHHELHHQTYINNLNVALEKYADQLNKSSSSPTGISCLEECVALESVVRFNAGGHLNHVLFWGSLCSEEKGGDKIVLSAASKYPKIASSPKINGNDWLELTRNLTQELAENKTEGSLSELALVFLHNVLCRQFGSFDEFKQKFNAKAAGVQGSGWCHLAFDSANGSISIQTRPNQDPIQTLSPSMKSLLAIDVWEHAYYLQYRNRRPEYLKEIWRIINWQGVADRLLEATGGQDGLVRLLKS